MARYKKDGNFYVKYPTRRKMAAILKRIIMSKGLFQEGTLIESVRINARVTGFAKLEIDIIAMYYFIFLNNGADLWNGGVIPPYDIVRAFQEEMVNQGITTEIYSQYTEWITQNYPMVEAVEVLAKDQKIVYNFVPVDPPAGFTVGSPLDV
jgi:hypothetical protein